MSLESSPPLAGVPHVVRVVSAMPMSFALSYEEFNLSLHTRKRSAFYLDQDSCASVFETRVNSLNVLFDNAQMHIL